MDPVTDEEAMAATILRYLQSRPDAADSLEGIAQWWLLRAWSEYQLAAVERALALLLARGLVHETRRTGQPPYYQINPDARSAAAFDEPS
jgi:hypothetical protein